jgi:hypothetical protein
MLIQSQNPLISAIGLHPFTDEHLKLYIVHHNLPRILADNPGFVPQLVSQLL